jgi:diacylglycerol kinase family enzyme
MGPTLETSTPALFFVVNGASGRQDLDDTLALIDTAVRRAGRTHHVFVIHDSASLDSTLRKAVDATTAQGGVMVAVGGDGTINAVASAALDAGCTFGAIPRGTFNYFGRTHRIPEEMDDALEHLLHGTAVPVQVGRLNDRYFLVNASVGLYPELLEDREQFKRRYGRSRLVALWSALVTAFGDHRHLDMVMEEGDRRIGMRTTTLFVGNNRLQLEQVGMPQAESLNQGQLAAIAVKPVGTPALLWLAMRGALGALAEADNVTAFSFRSLTVMPLGLWRGRRAGQAKEPVGGRERARRNRIKVAIDGEICWMQAPLRFSVAPRQLLLIRRRREMASAGEPGGGADDR